MMTVTKKDRKWNYDLSIVVPVYNEEEVISYFINTLNKFIKKYKQKTEVILVDDGSNDRTEKLVTTCISSLPHYRYLKLRRNYGQTTALLTGIASAQGKTIVTIDADLQNDPGDIPSLLEKIDAGYDVVCGWRKNRKDSLSKRFFSVVARLLRRILTGERMHDMGCTLKAFRHECFDHIQLFHDMHRYLPTILRFEGHRVTEVSVKHYKRTKGKTKYTLTRLYTGFLDLLEISVYFRYRMKRFHFFANITFFFLFLTILFGFFGIFDVLSFAYIISGFFLHLFFITLLISYHFVFCHNYPKLKTVKDYIKYEL